MCVFCDIVNKKIPASVIYENDLVLGFLDLSQATRGHTLIIPKRHVDDVFGLNDDEAKAIMVAAREISQLLKDKFDVKGINLLNNSGTVAGQVVKHFHLHVIPRYGSDDPVEFTCHPNEVAKEEFDKTFRALK